MDQEYDMCFDNFQDTEDSYMRTADLTRPINIVDKIKQGVDAAVEYISSIEIKKVAIPGFAAVGLAYFLCAGQVASKAENDMVIQHNKQLIAEQMRTYNPNEFSQDKELQEILGCD